MIALALAATATAYAKNMVMPPRKSLTLLQVIRWQERIIKHDRWVIKTQKSHRDKVVVFAKAQLSWTSKELRTNLLKLTPLWPAHHKLWLCIHSYEASDWHNLDTGGNGHYGGLQMHPGWGYGTSYYASSDSQYVQERAAENGYAASNYSQTWLLGQWYHPDCLKYA